MATHSRTFSILLTIEQSIAEVNAILPLFNVADETQQVRQMLLTLIQDHPTQGKQIHDANIVATMLTYNIKTLLTLNLDDFKRFQSKIKIVTV